MRFDSYHPIINLIYFLAVFISLFYFDHPIFVGISLLCAILYSMKLRSLHWLLYPLLLIAAVAYACHYSSYHHFGITELDVNFIGNRITLESIVVGLMRGAVAAAAVIWSSCLFKVVSSDKVVYLFGRISPKLSLFLSVLLRMVPRLIQRGRYIHRAQKGIGRSAEQGNLWQRLCNLLRQGSILVTWTLEELVESAASMKSRGYSLKGRTSFSIYRFDHRDRAVVLLLMSGITTQLAAVLLDQTTMTYDPYLAMNPITTVSLLFYVMDILLLLLPLLLQIYGEHRFQKQRKMSSSESI